MIPTPALRPWIADVTLMRPDSALPLVHLPDASTTLVYRRTGTHDGDLIAVGPRSQAAYFPGKELPLCIRARMRPGTARQLLGVPVNELRDQSVPLTDLWGERATRLQDRLNELTSPDPILRGIENALLETAENAENVKNAADSRDLVLGQALEALSTTTEHFAALARRLWVSERHLRDLFTDRVGLSPKHFARIQRVRTVLDRAGSTKWAQIASDTGYYDQSHMTADFHTLMGVSPAAFRAGRLPAEQPCAA
ncbi:transcriptional regulator, AraC family [Catenulispora acidiphila DSM 44928]|uniref:Transcriptional regulator, AraC family n=1 Tax=Catenulispora acidiphila (strain DSM 44928 / JCM 14897 / NBRC 102108 / NRRL B-24433 / ID139908) TaxID=479433 RepID=C7QGH0_CATAD|nr:helix-turn-helix domain-containing protein [Catenulispora acidiphila]ACU73015.1 transcriptional regulator, AraC family [Catenulispora acidiphila DSM 44928]